LSLNARYAVPLEHCIGTGDVKIFFLESVIASLKPVFLSVHSILAFLEQHDVVLHLILIAPSALMREVAFVFHCDMRTEEHDCMVGHQLALLAPIWRSDDAAAQSTPSRSFFFPAILKSCNELIDRAI